MYDIDSSPRQYARVAMYLRKSRQDLELEQAGAEDTLSRHRRILLELARQMDFTVTRIYQEVVSGDTIEARPEMRKLLADVEAGLFDAVLCHDIDRLGRGGMRDQGLILDTFKWSHTAIITPDRTYNLDSDMDEEAMEYKTQGARFEYRMIKKRLARGREASVREGKFIGHTAPYGYERYKLQGRRGWSLKPAEPYADVVRDIYRWYTMDGPERCGVCLIVRRLNERGIPGPTGKDWTNCTVRSILSNPVYMGCIRSKSRPAQKTMVNGEITVSRPRVKDPDVFPGLHEAIIQPEQFQQAAELLANQKTRPGPKQMEMKNPLAGLVYCSKCGRSMVRRPYSSGYPDGLLCPYTSCDTVSSTLEAVEQLILSSLRGWLTAFSLDSPSCDSEASADRQPPLAQLPEADELESIARSLAANDAERSRLEAQKAKAYDLVEQGVYTPEIFTARMAALGRQLQALADQSAALNADRNRLEHTMKARRDLLPNVRRVLEAYPLATTAKEKNTLLRSVLEKVIYSKTNRDRWGPGSDLSLTLIPKL